MIKNFSYVCLCVLVLFGCGSAKVLPTTGEVQKSSEKVGILVLNAKGYGTSQVEATDHAKEQVFINLFFREAESFRVWKAILWEKTRKRT